MSVNECEVKGEISIQLFDPWVMIFVGKLGFQTVNLDQKTT